jgi:hypothetical protein
MKVIKYAWEQYQEQVVPKDAGQRQLDATRMAFYGGATCVFTALIIGVSQGEEHTEADENLMNGIKDELDAFLEETKVEQG